MIRRRAKAKPAPPPKRKKRRRKPAPPPPLIELGDALGTETSEQALVGIAQDAVIILRRELAWRASLSVMRPGSLSMSDTIALLRLATELGAAAKRGAEGDSQRADYTRLSPEERVQLAALLLKVDYA